MIVYKYYPDNCNTFNALSNGYFFFSKAAKLNDPYDCSFKLIGSTQLAQTLIDGDFISVNSEQIMDEYGTCSFSKAKDSMHMWSFYANCFKGVVVGFDDSKFERISEPYLARIFYYDVQYMSQMIDADDPNQSFVVKRLFGSATNMSIKISDIFRNIKNMEKFFEYLCTIKNVCWKDEKERRLMVAGDFYKKENRTRLIEHGVEFLPTGYKIPIPDGAIKSIIIGHNMNKKFYPIIKSLAQKYGVPTIEQTVINHPFDISFKPIIL